MVSLIAIIFLIPPLLQPYLSLQRYLIMSTSKSRKYGSAESIFVLCETCHWCATYFDKSRVPSDKCLICGNTAISTFPILLNEGFAFNYNEKRGVELEFGLRKSKDRRGKERQ
jgi:hypothetical protein